MKRILLDTDFILMCVRWKVDLFSEFSRVLDFNFEVCIFDKTLEELKGKEDEKLALNMVKDFEVISTKSRKTVDELLLDYGRGGGVIVATQDKVLKEKLKNSRIPIITIRKRSHLELYNNVL